MGRRVVVTGVGALTPLGLSADESWAALCRGVSGVSAVTAFDTVGLRTRVAGQVQGFDPEAGLSSRAVRKFDRFIQLAVAAARMAFAESGLAVTAANAGRIGVVVGNSLAGGQSLEENVLRMAGGSRLSPFFVPGMIGSMAPSAVAIELGLKGPVLAVNTACASGANAIGEGLRLIRDGRADVVLAGGCEAAITRLMFCGYHAMKATTAVHDVPEQASRPFDRNRDGFVPAEGAGLLVLEALTHARARGAAILAEVTGYATTCDAYHITSPHPDGRECRRCLEQALADAGIGSDEVDCVNAHGTSTQANDAVETLVLKQVFGPRGRAPAVTANKSMIGHGIGAAGAVEAIFSILSIRDGVIPPTINYRTPDPACDLDYVPDVSRKAEVRVVVSNSFAFGGINAVLVLERFEESRPARRRHGES